MSARTIVVAEIGVNWVAGTSRETNEHTLRRLIDVAWDAGADSLKGQLKHQGPGGWYDGDDLSRSAGPRMPFRDRGEYVRHREPDGSLLDFIDREARARGIEWTMSPWDLASCDLLAAYSPPWVKIASACLPDHRLLRAVRAMGAPRIVLSTGGCTREEIDQAVEVIGTSGLTLAVCTMAYPALAEDLHLERIRTMRDRYGVPIGWSSHSADPDHGALAVAAGASWFESHITSGRGRPGPDHPASLDPESFRSCVWQIREAERAMGSGEIGVLACEEVARKRLRRSA